MTTMEVLRTSTEDIQNYDKESGINLLEAGNTTAELKSNHAMGAIALKTASNFNSEKYDIEAKSGYYSDTKTAADS